MNMYYFDHNGFTFKRINKAAARRAYINGLDVIITPCNLRPFGTWAAGFRLNKRSREAFVLDRTGLINDFENLLNSFMYYNCSREAGYYPAFYIPVTVQAGREAYDYNYLKEV